VGMVVIIGRSVHPPDAQEMAIVAERSKISIFRPVDFELFLSERMYLAIS
jgi:hypothetical protein